jgi:pimeloyl-ACP methyl ester carboxylesterase
MLPSPTNVAGVRIHHAELGDDGPRPPLVMLHGLNDSHLAWKHLAPAIARDRRVLMPDLPGHGLSDCPDASYELEWYADVMAKWVEALGVAQIDLVGHSFGGTVALRMLARCRARIRRLVLVSSGALGPELSWLLRAASVPRVLERIAQPFMGPVTRLLLRASHYLPAEDVVELAAMNARSGTARAFGRTLRGMIRRDDGRSILRGVNDLPPLAVFWGTRDTVIGAVRLNALTELADRIWVKPFDGAGHQLHHEQEAAFVQALREFLDAPWIPAARLRSPVRPAPVIGASG